MVFRTVLTMKSAFLVLVLFLNNTQQLVIPGQVKLCGLENNCFRVNKFEVQEKINYCTKNPVITLNEGKDAFFLNEQGRLVNTSAVVPCSDQEIKYSLNLDGNILKLNRFGNKMYVEYTKSDGEVLASFIIPPWLAERCYAIVNNKYFILFMLTLLIIGCIVLIFLSYKYNLIKRIIICLSRSFNKTKIARSTSSLSLPASTAIALPKLPTACSLPTLVSSQTHATSSQSSPPLHQSFPTEESSIWPQIQSSTVPSAPGSSPPHSFFLKGPITIESDCCEKRGYNLCQGAALPTKASSSQNAQASFDFYPPPCYEFDNQIESDNLGQKALPKGWKKCPTCPMVSKALHSHVCKLV
jgi:hypothetical protein